VKGEFMSNLKDRLIRLGNQDPELRKHIRPVLNSLESKTASRGEVVERRDEVYDTIRKNLNLPSEFSVRKETAWDESGTLYNEGLTIENSYGRDFQFTVNIFAGQVDIAIWAREVDSASLDSSFFLDTDFFSNGVANVGSVIGYTATSVDLNNDPVSEVIRAWKGKAREAVRDFNEYVNK
jgi:hypothetical protein